MAIDVGTAASDLGSTATAGYTYVDLANPSNAIGYLTSVEVWFRTTGVGLKVGIFYGSPTTYTCRSLVTIGDVTAGSKQTFSGFSIKIDLGDYIGFYWTSGGMAYAGSGGTTIYYALGDSIVINQKTNFTVLSGYRFAGYGIGSESQWGSNYLHARRDRMDMKAISTHNNIT